MPSGPEPDLWDAAGGAPLAIVGANVSELGEALGADAEDGGSTGADAELLGVADATGTALVGNLVGFGMPAVDPEVEPSVGDGAAAGYCART